MFLNLFSYEFYSWFMFTFRMAPRRPPTPPGINAEDAVGRTSPPSLVQLMATIEANHADQMRLLQQIERNTAAHQDDRVTIKV